MAMTLPWGGPTEEECPGGCTESTVNTTSEFDALEHDTFRAQQSIAAAAMVQRRNVRVVNAAPAPTETTTTTAAPAQTTAAPATTAAPDRCAVTFAVELGQQTDAAIDAIHTLDRATSHIDLLVGADADIQISYGGEWPTAPAPLGWTSPDRTQILINPDHPFANEPAVIFEIVSHELGHVFIGPQHVADGSLLDPRLNGQVMLNDSDRAALSSVTCADLGYG